MSKRSMTNACQALSLCRASIPEGKMAKQTDSDSKASLATAISSMSV